MNLSVRNTTPLIFQIIFFRQLLQLKSFLNECHDQDTKKKYGGFFAKYSLPQGTSCEILSLTCFWICFFE